MADVVIWKTAQEIIEYLIEQNQLVSGMSVAEAAAALGFSKTASGLYVKTVLTTSVTSVAGATASSVAEAAAAGATTTASNVVLFESAAGTAEVGGLASVALPVGSSVLAAAGGYLVGTQVYKKNSDFLDKLMFPLYDYVTGNNVADGLTPSLSTLEVPTMPLIFNASGNTFMDSRAYNRIVSFLDASSLEDGVEMIPYSSLFNGPVFKFKLNAGSTINVFSVLTTEGARFEYTLNILTGSAFCVYCTNTSHEWLTFILLSPTPFTATLTQTDKYGNANHSPLNVYSGSSSGKTFFKVIENRTLLAFDIKEVYGLVGALSFPIDQYKFRSKNLTDAELYAILFSGDAGDGEIPPDIMKYIPGTEPHVEPLKFPDELPDWVPVRLPNAVPGVMPEPAEYPDPDPRPEKITPYIDPIQPQPDGVPIKKPVKPPATPIVPVPNPNDNISTNPYPNPDPSKDPSAQPDGNPDTGMKPVPITEPDIGDTGSVPQPPLPIIPTISSAATGLLHAYNPTNAQINSFGSWLWTTFSGDLIDTISKLFNNPMDAVIGLHELYATPITGSETTIKAGYLDSGVASRLVTSRYSEIKCGAISVPEYWGNYLDYSPYTKTFCYLPFIGVVELNTDDIIGAGVEITYKIDSYNGSCIALITTAKAGSSECVTYEFSGNCAVEIPITSGMKSAVQSALIGAATAGIAVATGGIGGVASAALVGGVRQGGNSKNIVQHSGSFGSSYGAMGIKVPFIIVKRPKQKVVLGYNTNYGYPSHKMVRISDCSGYLKAIEVDVVSPTATENEKKMIEKQLKDGIFVN